ncbi:MAG: invasion associated locus B family protein [Rhodobacteraceae bacterium CG17_big_fil_post_rev_8_21_14_2_50_65_11]|nr:MAG: invasion associated locus B family protein [Rhodobacteraceae bacterium CG17_big_fil_post_rev_8_21_14_2_50_65_11]
MKPVSLTALLLATGLAMPLAAQDSEADAGTPSTAEATGLSLGQPEVGSTYLSDTFSDWELRCIVAPEGQPDPCQLFQLLTDGEGNAVAEFNVFDMPDDGQLVAGATIVTPLDTLLTGQMRLSVDDRQPRVYPFSFCRPNGCYVRLGLTGDEVQAFRAGTEATVRIVPLQAPDQTVPLTVSLSGFTAGFAALEDYNVGALEQLRALGEATQSE